LLYHPVITSNIELPGLAANIRWFSGG